MQNGRSVAAVLFPYRYGRVLPYDSAAKRDGSEPDHCICSRIFFPREATTKQILLTLSVFVVISGVAFAENDPSGIDQRQTSQEQRADQGIASGQLNEREADRLITQRKHINEMEAKAKSHGVMTERERDRIVAAQDRAARHIAREKPDRRAKRHR